jgi:hypothetical protein
MTSANIRIFRARRWLWGARAFKVVLDGVVIGRIRTGHHEQFEVASGSHELQVQIDFSKSSELLVELAPGESAQFLCDGGQLITWLRRVIGRQPRITLVKDMADRA